MARIFPLVPLWVFACCIICHLVLHHCQKYPESGTRPESFHCHYGSLLVALFAPGFTPLPEISWKEYYGQNLPTATMGLCLLCSLPHGFSLSDISWKEYYGQNLPTATMGFCLLHSFSVPAYFLEGFKHHYPCTYVCEGVSFIGWFFNYQSNWPPGFTPLLSTCMKEYHGQTLPPSCILKGALQL